MTVEENADSGAANDKPADSEAANGRSAAISPALLLMMLGRQVREKTDAELRNRGLSLRHLSALGHLAHQPGLSYSELARRDGITAQSMQSTLLQLQEIGAVERLTAPGRGRTADLQVTPSGQVLLDHGRAVLKAADQRLLDAIGNENADLIAQFALQALTAMNEWEPSKG
ncbi:MarR family winged helix-turn-helix transcriptional regulator [Kribbella sp. VKM Ac-2568]|uniref:MarR family winged helix-turn-helix transcriptional regulator n=1 Tax=Kribbella sp. VKM Ac-2568 TaxID=2512219 RepID=UPI0010DD382B|nr:MarR family transcriptional regulator [Kribbella sp. VKM Ac-2568]TCM38163.1 DNA-binding MarR family transcriptional regulator [Kribbella sp. VKM Ac-2568]